jgi:hypothetical protein
MKVGDLIYDSDYGASGLIVSGMWSFDDSDGQQHTWEFLVLLEDGELVGSDSFSLESIR